MQNYHRQESDLYYKLTCNRNVIHGNHKTFGKAEVLTYKSHKNRVCFPFFRVMSLMTVQQVCFLFRIIYRHVHLTFNDPSLFQFRVNWCFRDLDMWKVLALATIHTTDAAHFIFCCISVTSYKHRAQGYN